jgi:hypothetical protein
LKQRAATKQMGRGNSEQAWHRDGYGAELLLAEKHT